jgi:predicted DNA-binding transcriptional regulator AlpA
MTAETTVPDTYVSVGEACRQLGIGKPKFYELLRDGEFVTIKLPPHTQQARRKVQQASIDAFVARNREAASLQ